MRARDGVSLGWGVLQRMGYPSNGVIRGTTKEKMVEVQGEVDVLGEDRPACPPGRQGTQQAQWVLVHWAPSHG